MNLLRFLTLFLSAMLYSEISWIVSPANLSSEEMAGKTSFSEDLYSLYFWGVGDYHRKTSSELIIFCGEAEVNREKLRFSKVNLPDTPPNDRTVTAVLRFSPFVLSKVLSLGSTDQWTEAIQERIDSISKWANQKVKLQLDADCPPSLFGSYCDFIRELKPHLNTEISITCIGSWLNEKHLKALKQLECEIYLMLYTMGPSTTLKDWQGEVPDFLWQKAKRDLIYAVKNRWINRENIVVVLPAYELITTFDSAGKRVQRGSPLQPYLLFKEESQNEGLRPFPLKSKPAIGNCIALEVLQTQAIGNEIYRAGSVLIYEHFSESDWRKAADEILKEVGKIRLGLYHCGGTK